MAHFLGLLSACMDISERTRMEQALEHSEQRYRSLVECLPDAILVTRGATLQFVNPAAVQMFQTESASDLVGKSLNELLHPDSVDVVTAAGDLAGRRFAPSADQEPARQPDPGRARGRTAGGRSGRSGLAARAAGRERSARRSESELRQKQKLEIVGQLAGGVAHDFNNVLTVVLSACSLLSRGRLDAKAHDEVELIRGAAESAASLTRQLLTFARRQNVESRPFDLNELVTSAERLLHRVLGEDVELVVSTNKPVWPVRADPRQIEQVILNLASNARAAMPRGGRLTLTTANVELGAEAARQELGEAPGRYVLLRVSDTGAGMSRETLARIFEPFFTTKEAGAGLGLATCYGIVTQCGGQISAQSTPGSGSTFSVYLPAAQDGERQNLPRPSASAPHGGNETVLLVDDNAALRSVTSRILEGAGYRVLRAASASDAIADIAQLRGQDPPSDHRCGDAGYERNRACAGAGTGTSRARDRLHVRLHRRTDHPSRRQHARHLVRAKAVHAARAARTRAARARRRFRVASGCVRLTLEARLLLITFVESIGTILLERGIYFFTHERLHFSERQNLLLALLFGVFYVGGALSSHRAALRWGEKRLIQTTLYALLVLHVALSFRATGLLIGVAFALLALLHGLKWPVIESFYSAGQPPKKLLPALGRFNVCWALAVPIGVAGSGPLISARPELLFAAAALLNVVALIAAARLPQQPAHMEEAHPERPPPELLRSYSNLLVSARWSLLLSYTLMFLLAPLMPAIFAGLGLRVSGATSAAAALDGVRVLSFAVLGAYAGWQARWSPLLFATLVQPPAFAMMIWGRSLGVVLAGELVFGLAAGISYTTALYYALVVKNAAVDAGGAHEGLIGLGFALGPLCGLAGNFLHERGVAADSATTTVLAVVPVTLLCCTGALVSFFRSRSAALPRDSRRSRRSA